MVHQNIPKTSSKMNKCLRSAVRSSSARSSLTFIKILKILNTMTFDAKQTQNTCQTNAGNINNGLFYMMEETGKENEFGKIWKECSSLVCLH